MSRPTRRRSRGSRPGDYDTADYRKRELLRLANPEGHDVPEFMLHIEGDRAWWR